MICSNVFFLLENSSKFVTLLLLKILYILAAYFLLPSEWLIWSYGKNVNFAMCLYELVPFVIGAYLYCKSYKRDSVSIFFLTLFMVLHFIPSNSYLCLNGGNFIFYNLLMIYDLLFISSFVYFTRNIRNRDNDLILNSKTIFNISGFVFFLCLIILYEVYSYNGFNLNFSYESIYDARLAYGEYFLERANSLFSYMYIFIRGLQTWFLYVGIFVLLISKNYLLAIFALLTQVFYFTMAMQKSSLFVFLIILFAYYIEKNNYKYKLCDILLKYLILMHAFSILEFIVRGESIIFSVVINREMYMPVFLNNVYYEVFEHASKLWFRQDAFLLQNIISSFFGKPYDIGAVGVVSGKYFSGLIPSPNTGFFAEAYDQMGICGSVVFPFIHTFLFVMFYKFSLYYDKCSRVILVSIYFLMMLNTHVLLSGNVIGILIFIIFTINFVRPKRRIV